MMLLDEVALVLVDVEFDALACDWWCALGKLSADLRFI